jgi:hypothetical protein
MQILVRFLEKSFLDSQYNALGGIQARALWSHLCSVQPRPRAVYAMHCDR